MAICGIDLFHFSTHAPEFRVLNWNASMDFHFNYVRDISSDLLSALTNNCTTMQVFISMRSLHVLCLVAYDEATTVYTVQGKNITTWVQTTALRLFEQNVIAKKHFVSHIFHEIRNSLDVITLAVDELRTSEKSELLTNIDDNTHLIADILDDVVTFDNMRSMHKSLRLKPFMVHDLFKKCVHTMNTYLNIRGLLFTSHNELRSETLVGDYFKLKQVLVHFLSNAVKHARSYVQLDMTRESSDHVRVQIEDDGADASGTLGLHTLDVDTDLSDADISNMAPGTPGLAFLVARRIICLHNGSLHVSRIGYSTRVTITFGHLQPLPETIACIKASPSSKPQPHSECKVLVVDDNQMIVKLMCKMLERIGVVDVEVAFNGEDAVAAYANALQGEKKFTHVLMDQEMPKLDGNEATRRIKQIDPDALVYGITGNSTDRQHALFMEHGATRVVNKPVTEVIVRELLTAQ